MAYQVVWTPDAERELAAAWTAASDRTAVTEIVYQIEQEIRVSPLSVGESRRSSLERVAHSPPIALTFLVVPDDNRVFVTAVELLS